MSNPLTNTKKHTSWWQCCFSKYCGSDKEHEKSTDTRNKILMAAFEEIYHRGYQSASLKNILKETGITKGALYHHFTSKLEMGYAVVDEIIYETIRHNWIEPLDNSNDPISTLKKIMQDSASLMTEKDVSLGCPLNNLAIEMSPIEEGFRHRTCKVFNAWREAIERSFERAKLADNIPQNIDSKQTSLWFVASLGGCVGFAKCNQNLETLMSCGQGLIERLDSLRA